MLSTILRRSSPNRAIAAITLLQHFQLTPATSPVPSRKGSLPGEIRPFSSFLTSPTISRGFHVKSGPLEFKASSVTQAGIAVADYDYDEEREKGSEEGLEISNLGISPEIVNSLAKKGITKLFPIQKAVLEPAMQGKDMFGRARTGTGKTLAFGIPILDKIIEFNKKHGKGRNPLAMVMAPTRELARQVQKEFHDSAPSLDTICLYGGVPISSQMRELEYGVDVVVGTPGRIIDLMKRGSLNLSEIKHVVLDEADQMLGVGFVDDIETILSRLPKNRHSMCFSATMPSWIKQLVRKYLKDPLTIDLVGDSDKKLADGITLYSIASDMYAKVQNRALQEKETKNQRHPETMRFQRGDVVWARVIYPQTWYPGLVSTTDTLGIFVSFFNIIKPRYVVESEVRSFRENFGSLAKTIKCSIGQVLVDHVLKFIARRAVSSLKCPCQYPLLESENERRKNRNGDEGFLFCVNSVVGFVRGLGACPFVEDSDFVCAVSLVSQVQMLRRFMVTHQKFLLNEDGIKKKHNKDDCICLSASGNAAQLVTQKSVTSELEVESLREDQPSELLTQTKQTKPQPLTEMPVNLHCLAPNTFFMSECLNTVKQSRLRFGNLSYPSTSNLELRKLFCRSDGVWFSYPEYIRSQPSVEVDGKAGKEIFAPLAPDVANPINFTGVKRQNDQPADSGFSFKLLKSTPLFSISKTDAYHQKRRPELRVHISDNLIPVPAFLDSICNTRALLSSTGGDAHLQSRTRFVTGAEIQDLHSMHLVQNIPHVYLAKDASYCSNILERSMFLENKDNVALNDNGTCLPVSEMQEPGGITSIVKDCEALKPVDYDAVENIAEGILSEDQMDDHKLVLKLSTTMPVINYAVETSGQSFKPQLAQQSVLGAYANSKTYSDNDKTVNAIAATSIYLPYEPNTDQIQMKPSNSEDTISFGTSRRMSIISSFGGSLMNNECYLPGTFDPLVKPRLTERPAIGPFSSSIIYSEKDDNGNARAATSNCFPCKLNIDQSQLEHGDYDSATSVETSIGVSMISSFEGSSIDDKGHCRPDTTDLSFNPQVAEQSAVGAFDNIKTRSGNEKIGNCLSSELNTLRVLIQPGNSDNATSVETSRRVSMVSSSEGISMNNKERNIQGISEQPFKSKVSQQPAESTFTYSDSLQMKFPKDFILPSKMDLIRKFSRFGRVDPLKTEVFQLMGSAQVVFFDELDAVAAYQYAKRKNNLYGVATVLYWLDRSGQKRRGSNFLSPPSSSNLKSSLKKSSRRGKEDNKHTRRVRFRIET